MRRDTSLPAPPGNAFPGGLARVGAGVLYLCMGASFLGAAFLAVGVGGVHLFPYRMLLMVVWLVYLAGLATGSPLVSENQMAVRNYLLFLGLWIVYALSGALFIQDVFAFVRYFLFLFMGCSLIFFMVYYIDERGKLETLFTIWLVVLVVLTGIGIWEVATGSHLAASSQSGMVDPAMKNVPTGTFKMINHYATSMALGFPVALIFALSAPTRARRVGGALLCAGVIFVVGATESRLNLFAMVVEVAVAVVCFTSRPQKKMFGVIGGGLLLVSVVFFSPWALVEDTFGSAISQLANQNGSGRIRVNLILNGIMFVRDSFGFGVGPGHFNVWTLNQPYFSTLPSGRAEPVLFPHNWWIELLAEYGILIFSLYLAFFAMLFVRVVRVCRSSRFQGQRNVGRMLILCLTGFVFSCMGPGYFTAFRTQWVVLALAVTYLAVNRKDI